MGWVCPGAANWPSEVARPRAVTIALHCGLAHYRAMRSSLKPRARRNRGGRVDPRGPYHLRPKGSSRAVVAHRFHIQCRLARFHANAGAVLPWARRCAPLRELQVVTLETRVLDALKLAARNGTHPSPVVENGRMQGVVFCHLFETLQVSLK